MPWVRFDDTFPTNRKVDGLSDAAYRLHTSAIFWCSRNLTDGVVLEEDLELVTARVRMPARFAAELVRRGLWHMATERCESEHCAEPGPDGWFIHDYLEFQPSKVRVLAERAANADRQKKWREAQKGASGDRNGVTTGSNEDKETTNNGVSNGVSNGGSNTAPSRPVPEEPKTSMSAAAEDEFVDEYEEFWTTQPHRKTDSKHKGKLAYNAARRRGVTHEVIMSHSTAYRAERRGEDPNFTKGVVVWLNSRPWDNGPEPAPVRPSQKPFWEN